MYSVPPLSLTSSIQAHSDKLCMSHRDMIDYFCINAKVAVELKLICDTVHTRWVASLSPYKENTFAEELTRNNIMASFTELCYL